MRGLKHERVHQCDRCGEFDKVDSYCLSGEKDIHEPSKLRYCIGYKGKIPKVKT